MPISPGTSGVREAGALVPRERISRILTLALPIIGGMVSQNVMNLVDTAMVGRLGKAALAAVGIAGFANFMAQAFLMGLSTGVQAMAARRHGEGREEEQAVPLNGGLFLAAAIGVPLSVVLFLLAPLLFPTLIDDPEVVEAGVPYLKARLSAVAAVGMNFAFRGYWNGVNLSRLYMRTLIAMHAINIALSYVLIFGKLGFPAMGALGAGIGTAVATWGGTLTYFALGLYHARKGGFLRGLPALSTLKTMLRLSLPTGVQQTFFAAGLTALFWIVGQVGTAELAAANVLVNLMLVAILPGLGFGLAATSLVGQALGRKQPEDARRWGWDVVKVGVLAMVLLGLPMLFSPELVLRALTDDVATIAVAKLPLQIFGATVFCEGIRLILQNALLGAGDTRRVAFVSIGLQWGLFLPVAFVLGPVLGYGLVAIWLAMIGYNLVQAGVFSLLWQRGSWASIEV